MDNDKPNAKSFDALAQARFGDSIASYARGSAYLEAYAIRQCYPAIAALELDESFATLILTSRMDSLLARAIEHGAGRQGDAEELLYDTLKPLSSFSAKINMAYFLGFVSKRMFDALNCCRSIRNVYAHCDSPDDARKDSKYIKNKTKLLAIDQSYSTDSVRKLRESSSDFPEIPDDRIQITALMVSICDSLDRVAMMNKMHASSMKPKVIPAIYGFENPPLPGGDEPSVATENAS